MDHVMRKIWREAEIALDDDRKTAVRELMRRSRAYKPGRFLKRDGKFSGSRFILLVLLHVLGRRDDMTVLIREFKKQFPRWIRSNGAAWVLANDFPELAESASGMSLEELGKLRKEEVRIAEGRLKVFEEEEWEKGQRDTGRNESKMWREDR